MSGQLLIVLPLWVDTTAWDSGPAPRVVRHVSTAGLSATELPLYCVAMLYSCTEQLLPDHALSAAASGFRAVLVYVLHFNGLRSRQPNTLESSEPNTDVRWHLPFRLEEIVCGLPQS